MSFGRKCHCPLEEPPVIRRQVGGASSGSGWVRAAAKLRADNIERSRIACLESRRRSRSPRHHPGYSAALAIGPSARFHAQGTNSSRIRSRSASAPDTSLTAFRPLRKLSAFRYPLRKASNSGSNAPHDEAELPAAMAEVTQDVYAPSTIGPMEAKLRTIMSFLDCWGWTLTPYTPEVVVAIGVALKWRKYRSADIYIYLSRTTAQRQGAHISVAA